MRRLIVLFYSLFWCIHTSDPDAPCGVFDPDLQDPLLQSTYKGLPPLPFVVFHSFLFLFSASLLSLLIVVDVVEIGKLYLFTTLIVLRVPRMIL